MNKIFKVVWNKARCCYVVASEFAKSRTKSGRSAKAAVVAVAAALTLGMNGLALAADNAIGTGAGVAVGTDSNATHTTDVAVGKEARAEGEDFTIEDDQGNKQTTTGDSTAIGYKANAQKGGSTAVGAGATATGGNGTAVGLKAQAEGDNSTAIGVSVQATAENSTAVGVGSSAKSKNSIALGNADVEENADNGTALGNGAKVNSGSKNGTALGSGATVSAENGTAVGVGALAAGKASTALGDSAHATGTNGTALGTSSKANGTSSTAVGLDAVADGTNSMAIGFSSGAVGISSSALGDRSKAYGNYSIAIGLNAVAGKATGSPDDGIAIGNSSLAEGRAATALGARAKAYAEASTALGVASNAYGSYSTALGVRSTTYGQYSIAIGNESVAGVDGENIQKSIAIGYEAGSFGGNSLSLGISSKVYGSSGIAIGDSARIGKDDGSNTHDSIAIGKSSVAEGAVSMALGRNATASDTFSMALGVSSGASGNSSLALGYSATATSANNVALGASSNDTSGSGGYSNSNLNDEIFALSDKNSQTKITVKVSDFAGVGNNVVGTVSVGYGDSKRTLTNVAAGQISATSTDAINGSQLYAVTRGLQNLQQQINNIDISGTGGGTNQDHTVNGNDKKNPDDTNDTKNYGDEPTMNSGDWTTDGNLLIRGDEDTTTGNTTYDISLNPDLDLNSVTFNNKTVIDEDGIKFDDNHYITNNTIKMGDTVIKETSITTNEVNIGDISIKDGDVNMGDNQIHNVKAGSADTDAVNYGQLKQVEQNVANNSVQINKLKGRIDKVGAGAAALAALHPLDFDPDDKFYLSAGYGNYRGENAVAVGAFYQPNDDTLLSVSSTVGNDDDMINAGVTWRFGQSSHQSRSKKAMAKEIIELRTEVAELKAMVYSLTGYGLDLEKSKLFPDTPENHWAYDYVAVAAGNGILEGYPDGKFDGSRSMTRYEMAAVVYRLLQKGVQVDNRMLMEFAPELARVRVDTVTRYDDGTPHIQRVRVIEGRG